MFSFVSAGARRTGIFTASLAAILTTTTHAQVVAGITQPTFGLNAPAVFTTDVQTGSSSFLFNATSALFPASAPGFGGLAADEAGRRLFASVRNGAQDDIWSIAYGTYAATKLATVRRPGLTTGMSVEGLAYDTTSGTLYGTRSLGGSTGPEALVRIDTATGDTTVIIEYEPTSTSLYQINAIDYDPITRLLYLVDEDDTGGRNIYSVDPKASVPALTLVTAMPAILTDVDGLAAGNGKLYLVSDGPDITSTTPVEGNGGNHYVYDIAANTFNTFAATPFPAYSFSTQLNGRINPSAGAAFAPGLTVIPEPTLLPALALAGLLLRRR